MEGGGDKKNFAGGDSMNARRGNIEVFKNVKKDSFGHIPNLFANKATRQGLLVIIIFLLVC